MKTSIRDLKAKLSEHVRTASAGEDVLVSAHGRPVAKLVAAGKTREVRQLQKEPGILWNGGRPDGIARPAALKKGRSLADTIIESRR